MGIVTPTPTPPPSNDNFFKQIEKLQANFSKEDNKIWTDVNKEYKKLKNKKSKTEQHEKTDRGCGHDRPSSLPHGLPGHR